MAAQRLSISEYARHRGCDEKAVRKAIADGRIDAVEQDGRKLVDPVAADAQWAANTRARVRSRAPSSMEGVASVSAAPLFASDPMGSYDNARARREIAEAEEAEIRAARAAGRALDRERAERGAFDAFRELRDAVFAACKSQARRVQGLVDLREIEIALEDEMRAAFAGWEERMQQRLQQAAET